METRQEQIQKRAAGKVIGTVETCLCVSGSCQREALKALKVQIVKLFDAAIEGHSTGVKQ